jgi:hypothetical protein
MEEKFRLDRTVFAASNATDADNHMKYWKDKTYSERLEAAFFLINQAYGIDANTPLDRTVFSVRKRE